jgi:hypothetical protein
MTHVCILLVRFTRFLPKEKTTSMVTSLCINTSFNKVHAKGGLMLKEVKGKRCKAKESSKKHLG